MKALKVKNWSRYQHYKDRCPPWIKLATDTFQNYDFSRLHDASKLLALCIWTLASRSKHGEVPDDFCFLKAQGGLGEMVKQKHLDELISKGFLERSNLLAGCEQGACSETEGETEAEAEGETETDSSEPPAASEPPLLVFPCVGSDGDPREFALTQSMVDEWSDAWPGVNVLAEAKKALVWVNASPERRKTHRGMPKFLTGWCARTQDRGGGRVAGNGAARTKGQATIDSLSDWLETKGEMS